MTTPSFQPASFDACIAACFSCALACQRCATACLHEPDAGHLSRCVELDTDCAALCLAATGAMARNSRFAAALCDLCAQACDACADECTKHAHEHCKACAAACRACARACREMAVATA